MLSEIKTAKPQFAIMLLLFAVAFFLYYSSLLSIRDILSMDDSQLMSYLSIHELHLKKVLSPSWDGKYYRPVAGVSFLIDQKLYGDDPFGYRLSNVLIHALNVILLYLTSLKLLKSTSFRNEASFFAALLFCVHPIAVESISWISGRADPLALFWSLLAVLFYLSFKERERWFNLVLSILFMALAVLSKEVGLAIPIAIAGFEIFYCRSFGFKRWKYALPLFTLLILAGPLYLKMRSGVIFNGDASLKILEKKLLTDNFFSNIQLIVASVGFYFKKFLFPFPLNFAINEIAERTYAFTGSLILLGFALMAFIKRARRYHFLLFWALLGIAPAALLSITDIAWTRWGERYIYFSSAPLSIACITAFFSFNESLCKQNVMRVYALALSIVLCFSVATFQRSHMMNDNEKFFGDSHRKSPAFLSVAVSYANALMRKGKIAEAEEVLNNSSTLEGPKHTYFLALGHIYAYKGDYKRAKKSYNAALDEAIRDKRLVSVGPGFRRDILISLGNLELKNVEEIADESRKQLHYALAIDNFIKANEQSGQPFLLYRIAKVYLSLGDNDMAAQFLKKFVKNWQDDYYKSAAEKMLSKIEEKKEEIY